MGYSPWGHKGSDTTERLNKTHKDSLQVLMQVGTSPPSLRTSRLVSPLSGAPGSWVILILGRHHTPPTSTPDTPAVPPSAHPSSALCFSNPCSPTRTHLSNYHVPLVLKHTPHH